MTRVRKVLIVGGWIAGMAVAIRLRSDGVAVHLVDSDHNWRALGAGLTLNGATLRAFRRLDMLDDVMAASVIPSFFSRDVPASRLRLLSAFETASWRPEP